MAGARPTLGGLPDGKSPGPEAGLAYAGGVGRPTLGFAGVITLLMLVATGWIAGSYHLPLRDHDGIVGPSWLQLPVIAVLSVLVDVLPRVVRRAGSRTTSLGRLFVAVLRERWPASFVRFALAGLLVSYLVNSSFRNLKSWVPFVNARQWDDTLDQVDRTLWLGHDPATVLHDLLGTGWAAHVLSFVYVSWLVLVPFTLGIALLWSRKVAASACYVTALTLNWALGLLAYYLVPSLGPVYADPARFADLPHTYVAGLQESMLAERVDLVADPLSTGAIEPIAAFASLHVALVVTMVLTAHLLRLRPWVLVSGWVYLALTCVATVYLGWHYFVDDLGGVAIGTAAVWIAARATGQWLPGDQRVRDEADLDAVQASARPRTSA